MPKLGDNRPDGPSEAAVERTVLKRMTDSLDIHPRDVVVLKYKKSAKHDEYVPEDVDTWHTRRYFFRRNGAIYELYLDTVRKPGDDEEIGLWAEAVLVDFPTQEMTIRFAQIAARRAAAGGQKRIIPVGHPDYQGTQDSERPDDRGVRIGQISIADRGGVDLMDVSDPELGEGETIDTSRPGLNAVTLN